MRKQWLILFVALVVIMCLVATGCSEPKKDIETTDEPGEPAVELEVVTLRTRETIK